MRVKILVFPCGTEIGLEIYRALCYSKEVELWGGSSVKDHGCFVYNRYIGDIPSVENSEFITALQKITSKHKFDYIIPAHDSVVLALAEADAKNQLNTKILTSPYNTCKLARSKRDTYKFLADKVKVPEVIVDPDKISSWPVFIKPDIGEGSAGARCIYNMRELDFYLSSKVDLLVMEYLPGAEYTVDCFTDKNRNLVFSGGRRRIRVRNGISVNTKPEKELHQGFKKIAEKLNSLIEFCGAWFFQVKLSYDKKLTLLEIAPRIAGAMGLYRNLGINFPLMSLYNAEGYDTTVLANNFELEMDRALENTYRHNIVYSAIYFDFDDCIFINNKINPMAMALIFQARNKGKEVYLISKHKGDLKALLNKSGILDLFTDIIHITSNDHKSSFITHKKSIFIDDSFAERKQVHNALTIPVFAPDMIESLLETFQ